MMDSRKEIICILFLSILALFFIIWQIFEDLDTLQYLRAAVILICVNIGISINLFINHKKNGS